MPDATRAPASHPEQIGRYRIEAVLGRGAMGVIFKAHDPVIDRKVAIKLVRADLLEGGDRTDYITRFQQEAQAAGRCSHPNIVGIYDFALHDGNPYLAMEYIDGVTLNQVVARTSGFSIPEVIDLTSQMLDGLGAVHALGVVHRDIKPANIMLTERGRVKVTDFGISRLDTSHITGAGAVIGTPSYMSPEQCRGEATDARSDIFSVGVVLYELLTGSKPFIGKSTHEVWHRLLNEDPPETSILRPDAPAGLHAAIGRSLAKAASARFASAAEMAASLNAISGRGTGALASPVDLDRTVMAARQQSSEPGRPRDEALVLDSTTLGTIERRLARRVGPIAHFLLKSAMRKADTVETLCRTLADSIESPEGRQSFVAEMQMELSRSMVRTAATGARTVLVDADLARAQTELTRHVGPVARVLVKRAAAGCADVEQLWQRLAVHVERPSDRAAFLKARLGA